MGMTIEEFGKKCHDLLKAEPGAAGCKKVCELLKTVLMDDEIVARPPSAVQADTRRIVPGPAAA